MEESENDFAIAKSNLIQTRHYHRFRERQWPYMEDLADHFGLEESFPAPIKKLLDISLNRLLFHFKDFKNYKYSVEDDGTISDYLYPID